MANDYAVRENLVNRGIADSDIGYDQNSGQVQIKGQNFLKPELNVMGTTFTSQDNFNNAYKQYNKQQEANQLQQSTKDLTQRVNQGPAANPYNDQYSQIINDVMARMNAPQQDVYSTPQYAAAQGQQQRAAQQGIRSAQEALGSAGFGRSTALGETANRVQNDANEYLQLQMVPQIQQQLAAARQSEISNMYNMLAPVFNQVNRQDTLERNKNDDLLSLITLLQGNQQTDLTNKLAMNQDARSEAELTGNYMPNGAKDLINQILGLKQQAEAKGVNSEQMGQYRNQADELRRQLAQMGVDPSIVGYENDYNQASQNAANYQGNRTLAAQNQDFNRTLQSQQAKIQNEGNTIANEFAKLELANYPVEQQLKIEQLRKSIAEIGKIPYQSDMDRDLDQVKLDHAREELAQMKLGKTMSTQDVINMLSKSPFVSEGTVLDLDGRPSKTGKLEIDKPGMIRAITGLRLPEDQMDAVFNYYGINEKEIDELAESLIKASNSGN